MKMFLKACKYSLRSIGFYLWMVYLGIPATVAILKDSWWLGIMLLVGGALMFPCSVMQDWKYGYQVPNDRRPSPPGEVNREGTGGKDA